ncbi:hypothetical protein V5O48_012600 [Marasmius crinis-equi]|uniref:Uncharacterized protein n=1 Tax=Marasmius crinis-equi TaxID=585013 RepID=A0ABR3F2F1_9AGAR
MPVSPISASKALALSATLTQLIEYLTAPLHASYPASTVMTTKALLQNHFTSLFASGTLAPFSMILTSAFLPPTPILAACVASGGALTWLDWLRLLSGGKNLLIFVMEGRLQTRVGDEGELSTVWTAPTDEPSEVLPISKTAMKKEQSNETSPMADKINALLDSVRSRRDATPAPMPIRIPTLLPTTPSSEEDDSDSDSDTDSTASFSFSATSSDAETSISSPSTPASAKVGLPDMEPEIVVVVEDDFKPITAHQLSSRPQRRPVVDHSKKDVTRYMYQGGQTGVITGGVMLGGGKAKKPQQPSTPTPTPKKAAPPAPAHDQPRRFSPRLKQTSRKTSVMLGPDNDNNWRRRAPRLSA